MAVFLFASMLGFVIYTTASASTLQNKTPHMMGRGTRTVIDSPTISPLSLAECDGSLEFGTEEGTINIHQSLDKAKIRYQSVKMTGCGCFKIYSGKNGKGASRYLFALLGKLSAEELGFGLIRSIGRVPCPEPLPQVI